MKVPKACYSEVHSWRGTILRSSRRQRGGGICLVAFRQCQQPPRNRRTPQPTTHARPEPDHTLPAVPDRASDVSTHKPYTPVDPVGLGAGRPVSDSPLDRDPLKGGE